MRKKKFGAAVAVAPRVRQQGVIQQTILLPSQQQRMNITVPAESAPGQQLQVRTPDGQTLSVTVPAGVCGGATIQMVYTPRSVMHVPVVFGTPL